MATTENFYTGNNSTTTFGYSFPILQNSDLKVELDGVIKTENTNGNNNDYSISGTNVVFNSAPGSSVDIHIYRQTDVDSAKAVFAAGSSIRAGDLNNNVDQSLYANQEQQQKIRTADVRDNAVTTIKIKDLNVTRPKIANDAIDGTKIADDSVDSEHIVADSLDTEHYAASSIDTTAIANSAVTQNKLANNSVGTPEIINGAVTRAKLEADIIDGTKIADNAISSEHIQAGNVESSKLATDAVIEAKIQDGAVTTNKLGFEAVVNNKIGSDAVTEAKIADDAVRNEHIANNAVQTLQIQDDAVTIGKIADAAIVTNSEQASHSVDDATFFTTAAAEARYFNASTGETIKNGDSFPDNDTTIATTAAINDRIVDLVEEVGGFIPIASETNFPANNPDVNAQHGQQAGRLGGTIISVKTASTDLVPSGTTVTIANGAGAGNTVTITGVPSTIPEDFGFLVETTSTTHTYAFHRLTPKATEVTTVAGKAVEIGRLGTADAVADMAILGTADVVADLNTLATADVVADMNMLATSDVISDMNTLAVTDVINDMDTVATNVTNVNNVGGSISNVNTTAGSIANVNTVAGSIANVNTTAGSISNVNNVGNSITNVNTVASNISSVNSFANTYRIGSTNPTTSLDTGDLFFNTTSNSLKVYTGSAWVDGVTQTGDFALKTGNTFTGSNKYNDNVKAIFGTDSTSEIFNDGNDLFISHDDAGYLHLQGNYGVLLQRHDGTENLVRALSNGTVELYYDNAAKVGTTSYGVNIIGDARWGDNRKATFGNDGTDLQIYHDGTDNLLSTSGTVLAVHRATTNASNPVFEVRSNHGATNQIKFQVDGDGDVLIPTDTGKLQLGAGQDLQIYHENTNNTSRLATTTGTNIEIRNIYNSQDEAIAKFIPNGASELFFDGSKKLQTESTGVHVTGNVSITGDYLADDNEKIKFGDAHDFQIFHDGSANYIKGTGDHILYFATNNTTRWNIANDGHLRPQANQTYDIGSTVQQVNRVYSKEFIALDNGYFKAGTSADLQIYHNGSHSYIEHTGTGNVHLRGNGSDEIRIQAKSGEQSICCLPDAAVELYHDNVKKLQTVSSGIEILGTEGVNAELFISADEGDDNNDKHKLVAFNNEGRLGIFNYVSGGWEANINTYGNGAVELYYDNGKKFETTSVGAKISSSSHSKLNITSADNNSGMINLGPSSNDDAAQIWYDDYANGMFVRTTTNTPITVYTNNTQRLVLQNDGHLRPYVDSTYDLGTSSIRWRNVYADTLYGDGSNLTGISSVGGSTGVDFNDNVNARFGTGNDLKIYHNGTDSYIDDVGDGNLKLRTNGPSVHIHQTNGEKMGRFNTNGSVQLYYDNSEKFETQSTGAKFIGHLRGDDNNRLQLGDSQSLQIWNTGSNSYIRNAASNLFIDAQTAGDDVLITNNSQGHYMAKFLGAGGVELYYDNARKLHTTSSGIILNGASDISHSSADNLQVGTGSGSNGITIYSGSTSNGSFYFADGSSGDQAYRGFIEYSHNADALYFGSAGGTAAYFDSNRNFLPNANNSRDLGSSSVRWRNIYTNDLNLSNEGSSNDVDQTWGDWTIQEGESDLFLKNNRSGKKYKFNLTEVS